MLMMKPFPQQSQTTTTTQMLSKSFSHLVITKKLIRWEELSKQFSKFINKSSDDWVKFHEHWNSQRGSHPYLRIRYEDLMASPREILQQIVEFSFEGQKDTLEFVRSKLDCTYETMFENRTEGFKPRPKPSEQAFTLEQINLVFSITKKPYCDFGFQKYKELFVCPN